MADNSGNGAERSGGRSETEGEDRSDAPTDPRNIGDQSDEHSAEAESEPRVTDESDAHSRGHAGGQEEEAEKQRTFSRVSVVDEQPPRPEPPEGTSDEDYKWHTYKVYPSGRPDAVEFIDTYKSFGRAHILQGLNMA